MMMRMVKTLVAHYRNHLKLRPITECTKLRSINTQNVMSYNAGLSYVSAQQSAPLIGLTMHQMLKKRVHEHPDREMYVFVEDKERITFKDFKDRVERLAAGLIYIGLKKGDRLGIWCNLHMEFPLFVAAARSIGVISIRIPSNLPQRIVKNMLLRTDCKVLLLTRTPHDLYNRMEDIITTSADGEARVPQLDAVIGVGENNKSGTYSITDILNLGSDPKFTELFKQRENEVKFDDDSDIFSTSGSTGVPKLVVHTHFSIINGIRGYLSYIDNMPDKENRRFLSRISTHVSGEMSGVTSPVVAGVTSVYASSVYDIKSTVQTIQDESCTDGVFLIHDLYDILNYKDIDEYDISSLDVCFTGGSNIPPSLIEDFNRKFGSKVVILYGLTEVLIATSSMPWDPVEARCTAGKPLSNSELQVVDNDGKCVPVGSVGEVWCRLSSNFQRYFDDEERTKATKSPCGWFKSGDVGVLGESGDLSIIGRKEDMILKAGSNIFPAFLENVISKHPSVNQVQVIGVPDERLGEEVCVCVRTEENTSIDKEQIIACVTGEIIEGHFPGYVLIFDSFPTTAIGKIDRRMLTKLAIQRLESEQGIRPVQV